MRKLKGNIVQTGQDQTLFSQNTFTTAVGYFPFSFFSQGLRNLLRKVLEPRFYPKGDYLVPIICTKKYPNEINLTLILAWTLFCRMSRDWVCTLRNTSKVKSVDLWNIRCSYIDKLLDVLIIYVYWYAIAAKLYCNWEMNLQKCMTLFIVCFIVTAVVCVSKKGWTSLACVCPTLNISVLDAGILTTVKGRQCRVTHSMPCRSEKCTF